MISVFQNLVSWYRTIRWHRYAVLLLSLVSSSLLKRTRTCNILILNQRFLFVFFSKEEFSCDRINLTVFTAFKVFSEMNVEVFGAYKRKKIPLTFAAKGLINALLTFSSFHCRYLDSNKLSDILPDVFSELRNLKYV